MLWVVIIAGGKGERFWPRSVRARPKQFHPIVSANTMLQETFHRVRSRYPGERIRVVAERGLKDLILQQLPELQKENIIVEPLRKNTAPAIGLAATHLYREDPDALLLVLTADHVVHPKSEFLRALRTGARLAEEGHLVTFGMKPDRPATEYGYIEVHGNKRVVNGLGVLGVKMFREKPSVEQAEAFLEGGNFLWNSGMFAFSARSILGALEEYMPAMHSGFVRLRGAIGTERETAVGEEEFRRFKSISIDYAVMEKAKNILCVVPRFSWDDVGSWSSIARHKRTDGDGNIAEGNTVLVDCRDSIALGDGDSVVVLVGIRDLVVVKEGERFLVCHRSQDQRIREALKRMEADRKLRKFL